MRKYPHSAYFVRQMAYLRERQYLFAPTNGTDSTRSRAGPRWLGFVIAVLITVFVIVAIVVCSAMYALLLVNFHAPVLVRLTSGV
jgi:hypothetical protein